jgi:1,4-dihydroxy-2-naphthoate octaprenyltransferase
MILPAAAVGFLSAGVLNTNNVRDIENDRASNKNTLVVKIGLSKARVYHWFLITSAFVCMALFLSKQFIHPIQFISLIAFVPAFIQAYKVQTLQPSPKFNPLLKQLSLATLLFVVVFVVMQTIALGIVSYQAIQQFSH